MLIFLTKMGPITNKRGVSGQKQFSAEGTKKFSSSIEGFSDFLTKNPSRFIDKTGGYAWVSPHAKNFETIFPEQFKTFSLPQNGAFFCQTPFATHDVTVDKKTVTSSSSNIKIFAGGIPALWSAFL
jgi:hypothetical protein